MLKGAEMKRNFHKLRMGMSRSEVLRLFGAPTSVRHSGDIETLGWSTTEWKGFLRGGNVTRGVTVEIQNEVVVGYDGQNIDMSIW